MATNIQHIQDNFFIVIGIAFVVFTVVEAYHHGDRRSVTKARLRRNWQAHKALRLHRHLSGLHTAHDQCYATLRNKALATLSQARGLCELYRSVVQRHSIYDFEPEIPEFRLPPELEFEDPPEPPGPTQPPGSNVQDKEKRQ